MFMKRNVNKFKMAQFVPDLMILKGTLTIHIFIDFFYFLYL